VAQARATRIVSARVHGLEDFRDTPIWPPSASGGSNVTDVWATLYVFMLASMVGVGVIRRVSRLLHTPLMSITNAMSAIAVVGSILVAGGDGPFHIRVLGAVALFASMTNIVSGFLITNRMLTMFKAGGSRNESGA
jgi:H+-translocating NAD(P) transhydrogenase subunit alpha